MTNIIGHKTCGNCHFGKVHKEDLANRKCEGSPPQIILMPVRGGVQMQFHYPVVAAQQDACALHKFRNAIDTPEGQA